MLKKSLISYSFVFLCFSLNATAHEKPLKCPSATLYKRVKILAGRAEKTDYFAQFEEFCGRRTKSGGFIKHGPYRLWGPNVEVIVLGQFENGKKDGKWTRWIPTQTVEELWVKGRYIEAEVREPRPVTIDYKACVPQRGFFYSGDGFTMFGYEVLGAEGKYCKIRHTQSDTESIQPVGYVWTFCRVPRSQKKRPLTASENDLYCKKPNN